jgi:hypothetical protein
MQSHEQKSKSLLGFNQRCVLVHLEGVGQDAEAMMPRMVSKDVSRLSVSLDGSALEADAALDKCLRFCATGCPAMEDLSVSVNLDGSFAFFVPFGFAKVPLSQLSVQRQLKRFTFSRTHFDESAIPKGFLMELDVKDVASIALESLVVKGTRILNTNFLPQSLLQLELWFVFTGAELQLPFLANLRKLQVVHPYWSNRCARPSESLPSLTELDLNYYRETGLTNAISAVDVAELERRTTVCFDMPTARRLKTLRCQFLPEDGQLQLSKEYPDLEELCLSQVYLIREPYTGSFMHLRTLELSGILKHEDFLPVAPNLHTIKLTFISSNGSTPFSFQSLRSYKHLQAAWIANAVMPDFHKLEHMRSIRNLTLENVKICNGDAIDLADIVSNFPKLRYLNLHGDTPAKNLRALSELKDLRAQYPPEAAMVHRRGAGVWTGHIRETISSYFWHFGKRYFSSKVNMFAETS